MAAGFFVSSFSAFQDYISHLVPPPPSEKAPAILYSTTGATITGVLVGRPTVMVWIPSPSVLVTDFLAVFPDAILVTALG